MVFPATNEEKNENHHRILQIRIRIYAEYQLQQKILTFWTKFFQKEYFRSKTEKVSITIKFCIFELVMVPNFSLNWRFDFLHQIHLPKKDISSLKQKYRSFACVHGPDLIY